MAVWENEILLMAEEDQVRTQLCKLGIDMSMGHGEVHQSSRGGSQCHCKTAMTLERLFLCFYDFRKQLQPISDAIYKKARRKKYRLVSLY